MNNKITLLCSLLVIILYLSSSSFALTSPVIIDSEIIDDRIKSDESAKYIIYIENVKNEDDSISVDHDFLKWQVVADPYLFDLPAQGVKTINVSISPPPNVRPGVYSLTLKFHSENYPEEVKKHTLVLTVTENINSDPIDASLNIPEEAYSGNVDFKLNVRNKKEFSISSVSAVISSELFNENYTYTLNGFESKEEKDIENQFSLLDTDPGDYKIKYEIFREGDLVYVNEEEIILKETKGVSFEKEVESGFLTTTYNIEVTNDGHSEAKKELKATFSSLEKMFLSTSPEPTITNEIDGGEEVFWILTIGAGQTKTITYTISYQILFFISVVILLGLFLVYMYLKDEVSVTKKILLTKDSDNKKYVKVMLQIKNKTRRKLTGLKLIDWIQNPLNLIEKFDTLHPSLVKKKEKSIKIKWKIPNLDPKEEKIISYGTKAKMKIIGELKLPKAVVLLKTKEKLKKFWSNSPNIQGKE